MILVDYSSSSESDSKEIDDSPNIKQQTDTKKTILPRATSLLGKRKLETGSDQLTDNPSLHQGRIRSFKHERGNWATYIFISVPPYLLEDVQDFSLAALDDRCDFKLATELHVSLSKTVVLQYHFIEAFVKNLEEVILSLSSFSISFDQLKVYANAERTRTFVAVKVADIHLKKMLEILHKIDHVMQNFKLATFYEEPSFHISILWCVGDHVDLINQQLASLTACLKDHLPIELKIDKVMCKSGFKEFNFALK